MTWPRMPLLHTRPSNAHATASSGCAFSISITTVIRSIVGFFGGGLLREPRWSATGVPISA